MLPKVLLVSHDAGGAEVLAAWCRKYRQYCEMYFTLEGPALRIFQRDFGKLPESDLSVLEFWGAGDFVLTGTSFEASLEREAIALCRELKVHCVSFLDHWDLYTFRFLDRRSGEIIYPDEIWLGDDYAWEYALQEGLPRNLLRRLDNPYFEHLKERMAHRGPQVEEAPPTIIFICEPFSLKLKAKFHEQADGFDDEVKNIEKFLEAATAYAHKVARITVRPHPAEEEGKYEASLARYWGRLPLKYSTETYLLKELMAHTYIIGIESMALATGVFLGKKVISCITGKPWRISLPHREIIRISNYDRFFRTL